MKRITYNDLPTAVAELLDKMSNLEKMIREIKEIKKADLTEASKLPEVSKKKVRNRKEERSVSKAGRQSLDEPSMVLENNSDMMLDIEEASRFTGISKINLYSYVKNKKIPFVKENNGRLRFSRSELILWARSFNRTERKSKSGGRTRKSEATAEPRVQNPDHITLREIVKLVGKHPSAVYYLLRKKEIPVAAKIGNRVYYSRQTVMDAFKDEIETNKK